MKSTCETSTVKYSEFNALINIPQIREWGDGELSGTLEQRRKGLHDSFYDIYMYVSYWRKEIQFKYFPAFVRYMTFLPIEII